jgi:hypothetical protein
VSTDRGYANVVEQAAAASQVQPPLKTETFVQLQYFQSILIHPEDEGIPGQYIVFGRVQR